MQTQTILNTAFTIQILRNLARVDSIFVIFSSQDGNELNKPGCNEMLHPVSAITGDTDGEDHDSKIEYFMALGARSLRLSRSVQRRRRRCFTA